jgi:hypothetical protein
MCPFFFASSESHSEGCAFGFMILSHEYSDRVGTSYPLLSLTIISTCTASGVHISPKISGSRSINSELIPALANTPVTETNETLLLRQQYPYGTRIDDGHIATVYPSMYYFQELNTLSHVRPLSTPSSIASSVDCS